MPSFEQIRDRLPSLYRPGDDDATGEPLPLAVADVLELNGAPPAEGVLSAAQGGVLVTLAEPVQVSGFRLARSATPGSLAALELFRLADGVALSVPSAVARVRRGVATVAVHFRESRFLMRLKRPGLLSQVIWATSQSLDEWDRDASAVMQSRWLDFSDHARFSPFVRRGRVLQALPPLTAEAPEIPLFPYVQDLARLGSLLSLLPWREPVAQRERVEAYRQRIRRMVALYRGGLGTPAAMRRMIEAQLPVDLGALPGLQDRPFTLEEFAPLVESSLAVAGRGSPTELVGPLMRWSASNDGLEPAPATLYVQGVAPVPGEVDATERPTIELFGAGSAPVRRAIAYEGTLAPGQTLRLRPAYASWLGGAAGVTRATSAPTPSSDADPAAPGPWAPVAGAPAADVATLAQGADRALWAGAGTGPAAALHRFDGAAWTEVLGGMPTIHCLAADGASLLVGTEGGLLRLPLFPPLGGAYAPQPAVAALAGPAVHALLRGADGAWWVGTGEGLAKLGAGDALEPFVLRADQGTGTAVYALHQDPGGTLFLGTELGLFCHQPELGHWYWLRAEERSEQLGDWERFLPEAAGAERNFPAPTAPFLPPVHAVRRGPDSSLWIGTERGIARYVARSVGGASYTTLLDAEPDLAAGRVSAIEVDERGLVWFATSDGLFRHDGRDWWQARGTGFLRVPRGASTPTDPDTVRHWRFNRALDRWELSDSGVGAPAWTGFAGEPRGTVEPAVHALAWTDSAVADLGSWDGATFTPDPAAIPAALRTRLKPEETRIVDGGLPAVPRVPVGASEWRYLALEPAAVPTPARTPAWTIEGRLLPPPVDRAAVLEGRHGNLTLHLSLFDDAAFAFNPAARVGMTWRGRRPLTVLARLGTVAPGEHINPVVLDRVWQGIQQVRPAGVRALLAVDGELVRSP